jgi:hypothetical protein
MHLTNYSINKTSEDYVKSCSANINEENNGTKRTLSSLFESLSGCEGVCVDTIQENIEDACARVM